MRTRSMFSTAMWKVALLGFLVAALLNSAGAPSVGQARAPATWFLGTSPKLPPSDSLAFRRAIAHAVDRQAIAKAVAPHITSVPRPALSIQHPDLPGYNQTVPAYPFDPVRAKELYNESGWQGRITILVGPSESRFGEALHGTLAESVGKSLGAPVTVQQVVNFGTLVRAARSGIAPLWMYGWRSDPRDFAYPSFALALAHEYFLSDPEIKALVDKGDANAVERVVLEKALLIPIIHY